MAPESIYELALRSRACASRLAAARAWLDAHPGATLAEAAAARPDDLGWVARHARGLSGEEKR